MIESLIQQVRDNQDLGFLEMQAGVEAIMTGEVADDDLVGGHLRGALDDLRDGV